MRVVSTSCRSLDKMLGGGFPADGVSLIYGEAETGKTTLAVQCAVNLAREDYKTIFIDSDGTFSARKLSQIAYRDFKDVSSLIILVRPTDFYEQALAIDRLDEYLTAKVRLTVVDTITSLYRVEVGEPRKTFSVNRELNRQVANLAQIAKTRKVAVLVLSQVRSVFAERGVAVEPVANRVLKFWSDVVLSLKPTGQTGIIKAILEKHPKHKRPKSCYLAIKRNGIHDYSI